MIKRLFEKISIKAVLFIIAILLFMGVTIVFGDWQEPVNLAPVSPIGAPLVTQSQYQEKLAASGAGGPGSTDENNGSIGAKDFWIASVSKWMSELGGPRACDWTGWRCECATEPGGLAGRVIIGLECDAAGTINDFKIIDILVSSAVPNCTTNMPSICAINNRNNFVSAPDNLTGTYFDPSGPPPPYSLLLWNDTSSNEDGFRVEKYFVGTWNVIATLPANTELWNTGTFNASGTFQIRAFLDNDNINSSPSNSLTLP